MRKAKYWEPTAWCFSLPRFCFMGETFFKKDTIKETYKKYTINLEQPLPKDLWNLSWKISGALSFLILCIKRMWFDEYLFEKRT